jgi:RecB family endonuclease NucS
VPLREVWRHEAVDFTRWLEGAVDELGGVIGLDLTAAERERAAGRFSVDLIAEDATGRVIVIENQLEKSNHDHLGKLVTYLSVIEAAAAA